MYVCNTHEPLHKHMQCMCEHPPTHPPTHTFTNSYRQRKGRM